jgi:hypothetical protein
MKIAKTTCPYTGKFQYGTWQEAHAAICQQRKQKNGGKNLRSLMEYRCRDCGQFHIGHDHKTYRANARARQAAQPAATPQPKPLSPGAARRNMEHAQREAERHAERAALFADYIENINYARKLLDREIALTAKAGK